MRRREFVAGLAGAAVWPLVARAQSASKRWTIGLLASSPLPPIERLKRKLHELGYIEGENVHLDARFAEGRDDLYPKLAAELVGKNADVLIAWGTPAALAAKHATTRIPIVLVAGDVLNTGLVANLARPEGNITGFIAANVDLEEKRLDTLREIVPNLKRIGILANARNPLNLVNLQTVRRAAELWNLSIDTAEINDHRDIGHALENLAAGKPDAAILGSDIGLLFERKRIIDFMNSHRIPAIYPFREYAADGGLIVQGANISTLFELAAGYVDRIVRGSTPASLPIQQATSFELTINSKAAKALGLTIPPSLLARADEVIE